MPVSTRIETLLDELTRESSPYRAARLKRKIAEIQELERDLADEGSTT